MLKQELTIEIFFFFASHTEKHIEGVENISILTK